LETTIFRCHPLVFGSVIEHFTNKKIEICLKKKPQVFQKYHFCRRTLEGLQGSCPRHRTQVYSIVLLSFEVFEGDNILTKIPHGQCSKPLLHSIESWLVDDGILVSWRNNPYMIGYSSTFKGVPNGSSRVSIHHPLGFNWHPFEGAGYNHLKSLLPYTVI